jgi:hypothetical protein
MVLKIAILADAKAASLHICLLFPLEPLVRMGLVALRTACEAEIDAAPDGAARAALIFADQPDVLILSRFASPYTREIIDLARERGVPIIAHLDDNLMEVGADLGPAKYKRYNDPQRKGNLILGLAAAQVIYTGNDFLARRIEAHAGSGRTFVGRINSSGFTLPRREAPALTLGYMATGGHSGDLEMIAKDVIWLLEAHPRARFELFGSIAAPAWATAFGDRFTKIPPTGDYPSFLKTLAGSGWRIGLAPLVPTTFNLSKSNCKWIEYTCCGIATIASDTPNYAECCAAGRGALCAGGPAWRDAMGRLIGDAGAAQDQVERGQKWLASNHSPIQHTRQTAQLLQLARKDAGEWHDDAMKAIDSLAMRAPSAQSDSYGFAS